MPFITQGKTNWKFILIVIILAVIVGGGALWCVTRPEKPYQPLEIEKSETANWKTYGNEEYGFEIKYPDDWRIHEVEDGYIGIVDTKEEVFPQMVFQKRNWMGITIHCYSKPTDFAWKEWLKKRDIVGYEKFTQRGLEVVEVTERTGIFPGEVFFGNEKKICGFDYMSEYFNEEGSIDREKEQKCLDIFNQILSTFRFLE